MGQTFIARRISTSVFLVAVTAGLACDPAPSDDPLDAADAPFASGKADSLTPGGDEARAVLALVNDSSVGFVELDDDVGLHATAAENIIAHRDGPDGIPATDDDDRFDDLAELDAIPFIGPAALDRLLAYATAEGYLGAEPLTEVVFSPQPSASTHNARVAQHIAGAEHSIDVAIYSFSNAEIREALAAAVNRGVEVRFLYETANDDRRLEGQALQGSRSAGLENMDIDVRYVNKIMHHKFMIIDGPRDDLSKAGSAMVASGSANWSNSAGTHYDENTLFLRGHEELTLRLQAEFNHLWNHSRNFDAGQELAFSPSEIDISAADLDAADGPASHAFFTSDNFDLQGDTTFTRTGRNTVSDQLIAAIEGASASIHLASGHLRHRGIAEALMAKAQAHPAMDIRIYLDGQEHISASDHQLQVEKLEDCLQDATTEAQTRGCFDRGFLFGFAVGEAGADVRYKSYAYRWHYTYAAQMHHKYMIIDGDSLWTGSYNLSDNAEHNTMENVLHLTGAEYAPIVAAYEANFEQIWNTGRTPDLLSGLREEVQTAAVIPLVFDSMALDWSEVVDLEHLIEAHCPQVSSLEFEQNPESHLVCER
jgi:phosphatidylserine/phosphatidylglycerophosphate/cardiolipin synthase-like enzyme